METSAVKAARKPRTLSPLTSWVRAFRVHQWVKNALILVPVLTAHRLGDLSLAAPLGIAFLAFSLAALSIYLINDLADLQADRNLPTKKDRPLAAGEISARSVFVVVPLLLLAAGVLASRLTPEVRLVLGAYLAVNCIYTFWIKRFALLDVFCLAGLFRLLAGHAVTAIPLSPWLLGFTSFFFLSLAFAKRMTELGFLRDRGGKVVQGRGYEVRDIPAIGAFGVSPPLLWLVVPTLLLWFCHIGLLAYRGELKEDPTSFALSDGLSWMLLACVLGVMAAASY